MDLEQHAARVESATALPADLQSDVTNEIKKKYGAGVSISFAQIRRSSAACGFKLVATFYDGSVKMRLEKLEESF